MKMWESLSEILQEPTCIVGVGNYYKSDDAVGLYIADTLKSKLKSEYPVVLNVEDIIEGYVYAIAEGDFNNVIIIDAVDSEAASGSIIFGRLNEMNDEMSFLSTHKLSLRLSGRILENHNKKTYLLGIIPKDIDYGIGLSNEVEMAAEVLKNYFLEANNCIPKGVCQ